MFGFYSMNAFEVDFTPTIEPIVSMIAKRLGAIPSCPARD